MLLNVYFVVYKNSSAYKVFTTAAYLYAIFSLGDCHFHLATIHKNIAALIFPLVPDFALPQW
jgi:hypothetical protein